MQTQHFDTGDVVLLPGQHHATLAGNDILGDIKAKTTEIAKCACFLSVKLGFYCMGTILNNG